MRSTLHKKRWVSANSAFCLFFLLSGLLLVLIHAQFEQQPQLPMNSQNKIFTP